MQRVAVAIEAAKAAGAALRVAHDHDLKVEEKNASRTSIVTSADLQSQDIIFGIIRRAFPDDAIVGEEGNHGDERAAARWYVDPLDGTTNFSHRLPFSCVSIAYCDGGAISLGVVYDPHRDDLFVATRGGGAFRNGERIGVSGDAELRTCLLATQVQSDDTAVLDRYTARMRRFLDLVRGVRVIGAPALALAYVACGWLDAFCEDNMSPWDTLAGSLLIQEAGGAVTDFQNRDRPSDRHTDILASNGRVHDKLISELK
jgi:myo-inositol-1(or 4)-monophosphatase